MSLAHAIILGIVQGLSEFLPVSSSAHLTLVPWLFHWNDPGLAFDVALHVGTLIAVLWYFRAQWIAMVRASLGQGTAEERRRVGFLVIATIPGAIAGLALEKQADSTFRDPRLIAVVLIAMGILLWWIDKAAASDRSLPTMTVRDALLVGLAQMFAIVPGVSRSGSTITAGRALRFTREDAAVFSFLMSMPIIAAAAILKLPHVLKTEGVTTPLVAGVVASAVSGWLAIAVLLRFVVRRSYGVFAAYRVIVGLIVLGIAFFR
ncbi:MAG TPA: undecaprenyl-diphosphate phosphatase [Gemmatimonadaceae bacterium]|nr:undecaprenyl-diphosphate phosphatase [Gemmatimonadaceae bacterium]